ncbi:hypothetical protein RHGRI_020687 [Rhododendron griersonianum]|uniref:Uncharacterized protein n=1 Tax=Rhododendron griersonianum TaxID=479676 RepID=A0AAV6JMJ0_9ERIC|nr:hypothetical protein RHGRI_020687 [Rhododendron griersonianum]
MESINQTIQLLDTSRIDYEINESNNRSQNQQPGGDWRARRRLATSGEGRRRLGDKRRGSPEGGRRAARVAGGSPSTGDGGADRDLTVSEGVAGGSPVTGDGRRGSPKTGQWLGMVVWTRLRKMVGVGVFYVYVMMPEVVVEAATLTVNGQPFEVVPTPLLASFALEAALAKKVSLADIGIVGGLSDGSDEKDKGPPTSFYMGRAMGAGSGIHQSSIHTLSICAFLLTCLCGECSFTSRGGNISASGASRPATANNDSDKYASVPAQNSIANSNNDDDFDDFDPRGTSGTKSALGKSNQVDLFGQSLVGDLMDAPAFVPEKASTGNSNVSEVDLFADATFVSAPPHVEAGGKF